MTILKYKHIVKVFFAFLFLGVTVQAQIDIGIELQHRQYLQQEPIIVFITIVNKRSVPLIINDEASKDIILYFDIIDRKGRRLRLKEDSLITEEFAVAPYETLRKSVQVSQFYVFNRFGGYLLEAVLRCEEFHYKSHIKHVEVVSGLPIGTTFGDVLSEPIRRRKYELRYITREGSEVLFLQVADLPEEKLIGTFLLGPLIRIMKPKLEFKNNETFIVKHQCAPYLAMISTFKANSSELELVGQKKEDVRSAFGG